MTKSSLFLFFVGLLTLAACKNEQSGKVTATESNEPQAQTTTTTTTATALKDGSYTMDTQNSKINWTGRKKFTDAAHVGDIQLKEGSFTIENGKVTSGSAIIDMNSIENFDQEGKWKAKLVNHLKSPEFFDVAQYPTGKVELKSTDGSQYTIALTLKDKTHDVVVPAEIRAEGDKVIIILKPFTIDRTQWGVNYNSDKFFKTMKDRVIKDEIELKGKVVLTPAKG